MPNPGNNGVGRRLSPVILTVVVTVLVAVGLAVAAAWQDGVSKSRQDDADAFKARASLIQEGGSEGSAAAELLRTYVQSGDEALIPQIQSHGNAGIEKLTTAVAEGGSTELKQIVMSGASLAEGSGRVISLRRQGDIAAAAASLDGMRTEFDALKQGLQESARLDLDEASSLQSSADSAADTASWLRVAAAAMAVIGGLVLIASIVRYFVTRKAFETTSAA